MPIYEFYCPACHMIFNFFSRRINTEARPECPKCRKQKLERKPSVFAVTGRAKEPGGDEDLPVDPDKMEKAVEALAGEMDGISEDDPKQAARLMKKLTDMTGLELGPGMKEAMERLESGEDPEKIEAELGDILENEDPFVPQCKKARPGLKRSRPPARDDTLYELE